MKSTLLLFLVLVSGMAVRQSNGGYGSSNQQQPSGQQQTPPPTAPPSTAPGGETTTGQTEMKGCLRQSGGNWVLIAENGQTITLSGDISILKPHDGRQVQVQGAQANGGSFQVSSVSVISDSCTTPR